MFIGTQYFRPPNPPMKDWERDLKLIKEQGLEIVRTWIYWCWVNPRPQKWVWDDYDRFMDMASKTELKVLVQLMIESAPEWLAKEYPEARFVDEYGHPIDLYAVDSHAIGGIPGLNIEHPEIRARAEEYYRKVVRRYKNHPALHSWDIWNEVEGKEISYDKYTQKKYQKYLKSKYKTIDKLNQKWGRSYQDFFEVPLAPICVYGDGFDRMDFEMFRKADWMKWRAEIVRTEDPNHPLVSHDAEHWYRHDHWQIVKHVDIWGTSCYKEDIYDNALCFTAVSSAAGSKPWWLSENTGGRTYNGVGQSLRTLEQLRRLLFLAFGYGAEGCIYWQWRPERYGQEATLFGLTKQDGQLTDRVGMVKEVCQMLSRHKDIFDNLNFPAFQVGLIWEPKGRFHDLLTTRYKEPERSLKELQGYFNTLIDLDYQPCICKTNALVESGIPEGMKLLIYPYPLVDNEQLAPVIKEWVKQGGTFVAGPRFGCYASDSYANETVPPSHWQDLFGVKDSDTYYPDEPMVEIIPIGQENNRGFRLIGDILLDEFKLKEARILGVREKRIAATINKFGKGISILLGSFFGRAIFAEKAEKAIAAKDGLSCLLDMFCGLAGVHREVRITNHCWIRPAYSGNGHIFFVYNPDNHNKTAWVNLIGIHQGTVQDLLNGKIVARLTSDEPFPVSLKANDARILLWQSEQHSRDYLHYIPE